LNSEPETCPSLPDCIVPPNKSDGLAGGRSGGLGTTKLSAKKEKMPQSHKNTKNQKELKASSMHFVKLLFISVLVAIINF
jgi:hypothetical protein